MKETRNDKAIDETNEKKRMDFEAKQNLLGFFELLLKIDMRNHPEKYKNKDGNSNNEQLKND